VKRPTTLRSRLALVFAGGVLGTLLLQSLLVTVALVTDEWLDRIKAHSEYPSEDMFDDVRSVLGSTAVTAPFVVFGALVLGRRLAHRALAPMREASQRARAARASVLDLSLPLTGTGDEWDELASTLNALLAEARGTVERIRRFTSDAAHELRTPLTVLIGETEVMLRRERSAEEYRHALEVVGAESRELAAMVDALLTLSRADAGTLVVAFEPMDLLPLAQGALRRAQRLLEVQSRSLRLELVGDPTLVRGDALLLARVLDNLLSNALRYGRNVVRLEVGSEEGRAQVCVVDDGPGVPPEFEPRLFQRFARADVARSGEGVGLGLSLSRAIAEAHSGSLDYKRTVAGESRFILELPLLPE
jgi:signal transduction histidine kinase